MSPGAPRGRPSFSFVIPVFNEAAVLGELYDRLAAVAANLDGEAELVFVDDGSKDASGLILQGLAQRDRRVRIVELSRNFGQAIAISAGLDFADGDAVVVMDADLQDPPELIPDLVARWREGYDVVSARRIGRQGESAVKRASAAAFYRLMGRVSDVPLPEDVGEFRLIDRRVVEVFRRMRERHRYVRGMIAWAGFRHTSVPFERPSRHAGDTKFTFGKMVKLAWDALSGFSQAPLKLIVVLGALMGLGSFLYGIFIVVLYFFLPHVTPGWSTIVVLITFLSGMHLITTGIVGLYVGKVFEEVKDRPLYIVRATTGLEPAAQAREQAGLGPPVEARARVKSV